MTTQTRTLPVATALTLPYWKAARDERLVIQQCLDCSSYQFFPRLFCLKCMSENIEWRPSSGHGTIYTFTVNRRGSNPYMNERVPYVVAMVTLDEGVRIMANIIESEIGNVRIGARVGVVFEKVTEDITLPQFRLL
jgi:hypothetical protein